MRYQAKRVPGCVPELKIKRWKWCIDEGSEVIEEIQQKYCGATALTDCSFRSGRTANLRTSYTCRNLISIKLQYGNGYHITEETNCEVRHLTYKILTSHLPADSATKEKEVAQHRESQPKYSATFVMFQ
jgi:hypothetical protein